MKRSALKCSARAKGCFTDWLFLLCHYFTALQRGCDRLDPSSSTVYCSTFLPSSKGELHVSKFPALAHAVDMSFLGFANVIFGYYYFWVHRVMFALIQAILAAVVIANLVGLLRQFSRLRDLWGIHKPDAVNSSLLILYSLTSVYVFSLLFSIHFLRCWQREFI